jgi:hypothetical protein
MATIATRIDESVELANKVSLSFTLSFEEFSYERISEAAKRAGLSPEEFAASAVTFAAAAMLMPDSIPTPRPAEVPVRKIVAYHKKGWPANDIAKVLKQPLTDVRTVIRNEKRKGKA